MKNQAQDFDQLKANYEQMMKKYIDTNNEFNAYKDKCANSISEQRMEIAQLMIDLEKVK